MTHCTSVFWLLVYIFIRTNLGRATNRVFECEQIRAIGEANNVFINATQCFHNRNETCARASGIFLEAGKEQNFRFAGCFSKEICAGRCEDFLTSTLFDGTNFTVNITECILVCCNSSNCNNQTVTGNNNTQPIQNQTVTDSGVIAANHSQTTSMVVAPTCSDFISITGEESIEYSSCIQTSDTVCFRLEAEGTLSGFDNAVHSLIYADCFPQILCSQSCEGLVKSFLSDIFLNIRSCHHFCCTENNCNNQSLSKRREQSSTIFPRENQLVTEMTRSEVLRPRRPPPPPRPPLPKDSPNTTIIVVVLGSVIVICLTAIIIVFVKKGRKKPSQNESQLSTNKYHQQPGSYATVAPQLPERNLNKGVLRNEVANHRKQDHERIYVEIPPSSEYVEANEFPEIRKVKILNETKSTTGLKEETNSEKSIYLQPITTQGYLSFNSLKDDIEDSANCEKAEVHQ